MTRPGSPRPTRRRAIRLLLAGWALWPALAVAQVAVPPVGFAPLPSFAWPQPAADEAGRWSGSFARLSTGFEAVSSRRFGGYAGPTLGFEAGRLWQEGRLVAGVVGGFDTLTAAGGGTPGFGRLAYTRDFAGALHVQVGALLAPTLLLYAKAGAAAVHETLRLGPTPFAPPLARESLALRPDARVGVEWAVTDRLSVAVEAGVAGGGLPR